MTRPIEQPVVTKKTDDPTSDSATTHPAFGKISASRFSCNSSVFYGSDFVHNGGIAVTIHTSELMRGLSNDHHFARKELIRVEMSAAQWASFISNLNAEGVPCTLDHVAGKMIPALPEPEDMSGRYAAEMHETILEIQAALRELRDDARLPVWARKIVDMQAARLTNSTGFIAEQFGEHVEKVVESAKVEVEAYVNGTVRRAGLEAIANGTALLALPGKGK